MVANELSLRQSETKAEMRSNRPSVCVRPHVLLEVESPDSIRHIDQAPEWVHESLRTCPYAVVRRHPPLLDGIAIGVRGSTRSQRWPAIVNPDRVTRVITPSELRDKEPVSPERLAAIPALRHLLVLREKWSNLNLDWGPGGSVGFELASGYSAATPSSDLDIVLLAPHPFSHDFAHVLLDSVRQIAGSIDVIVEAPECAFSLDEYAGSQGGPVLLRYADKPRLGADPWRFETPLPGEHLLGELEIPV
jgi:phosphoribosyl-dephospho-CoA transferase